MAEMRRRYIRSHSFSQKGDSTVVAAAVPSSAPTAAKRAATAAKPMRLAAAEATCSGSRSIIVWRWFQQRHFEQQCLSGLLWLLAGATATLVGFCTYEAWEDLREAPLGMKLYTLTLPCCWWVLLCCCLSVCFGIAAITTSLNAPRCVKARPNDKQSSFTPDSWLAYSEKQSSRVHEVFENGFYTSLATLAAFASYVYGFHKDTLLQPPSCGFRENSYLPVQKLLLNGGRSSSPARRRRATPYSRKRRARSPRAAAMPGISLNQGEINLDASRAPGSSSDSTDFFASDEQQFSYSSPEDPAEQPLLLGEGPLTKQLIPRPSLDTAENHLSDTKTLAAKAQSAPLSKLQAEAKGSDWTLLDYSCGKSFCIFAAARAAHLAAGCCGGAWVARKGKQSALRSVCSKSVATSLLLVRGDLISVQKALIRQLPVAGCSRGSMSNTSHSSAFVRETCCSVPEILREGVRRQAGEQLRTFTG
ncbi:uncharacterized protein LOC34618864 [Cyclospora cayetanensis]|uniref:Uncharacterized protein LOC34618864 n=1 Tax=Cyclospora cayetanensis TaxID=88456 RepID=A0A6P6S2T7_9EIME|nr:uncharacterized protein LOC34618864 [Cyclospora cayetanensis]